MSDYLRCSRCDKPIDMGRDPYNAYEDGTVLCPECEEVKEWEEQGNDRLF